MKKNTPLNFTSFTFGITVLGLVIFLIVKIFQLLWKIFAEVNPTVGAGIVAATATVIVSVVSVLVAKRLEQKSLVIREHRERKTPIYEEIVKLVFRFAFSEKIGLEALTEKEIIKKMAWITENLVIWGSDDLLLAWSKFRKSSIQTEEKPNYQVLFEVEDLLLAIRKDLGHSNKGLKRGQILGLFINDIDNYLSN
ncbi:hypothetical protein [Comamonas sp. CMM02]|uniref:hypothetical protein n=1 Tax=Comamonas sp. CMM02 TaxID=2769307 RepID=UPI0017832E3A|nr:hypothetical protein [Comamonas sp. CMM02]MBD9402097.1 hypothetical protein [Comamonas sp. CMM02]